MPLNYVRHRKDMAYTYMCKCTSVSTLLSLQVYQLQVTRSQSSTTLFRRYREFDELHSRLALCFPGDNLPNFPGNTFLPGKSRARETVEKRLVDLNKYISDLLEMEARVAEVREQVIYIVVKREIIA